MMEQFVALRHRHGTISDMVGGRTKVSRAAAAVVVAAAAFNAQFFLTRFACGHFMGVSVS